MMDHSETYTGLYVHEQESGLEIRPLKLSNEFPVTRVFSFKC